MVDRRRGRTLPLAFLLLLLAPVGIGSVLYHELVSARDSVDTAWSRLESHYRRRSDFVAELAEGVRQSVGARATSVAQRRRSPLFDGTLQRLVRFREHSLSQLTALRGRVPATEEEAFAILRTQGNVERGLLRLFASLEGDPTLGSDDRFLERIVAIERVNQHIVRARMQFNTAVRRYNAAIRSWPHTFVARLLGPQPRVFLEGE